MDIYQDSFFVQAEVDGFVEQPHHWLINARLTIAARALEMLRRITTETLEAASIVASTSGFKRIACGTIFRIKTRVVGINNRLS